MCHYSLQIRHLHIDGQQKKAEGHCSKKQKPRFMREMKCANRHLSTVSTRKTLIGGHCKGASQSSDAQSNTRQHIRQEYHYHNAEQLLLSTVSANSLLQLYIHNSTFRGQKLFSATSQRHKIEWTCSKIHRYRAQQRHHVKRNNRFTICATFISSYSWNKFLCICRASGSLHNSLCMLHIGFQEVSNFTWIEITNIYI